MRCVTPSSDAARPWDSSTSARLGSWSCKTGNLPAEQRSKHRVAGLQISFARNKGLLTVCCGGGGGGLRRNRGCSCRRCRKWQLGLTSCSCNQIRCKYKLQSPSQPLGCQYMMVCKRLLPEVVCARLKAGLGLHLMAQHHRT